MKIDFYKDSDGCCNAKLHGQDVTSNEIIVALFYDFVSDEHLDESLSELKQYLNGDVQEFEFGDNTNIEIDGDFSILSSEFARSKKYKLRTTELFRALEKWKKFRVEAGNNKTKTVDIQVVDS